MKIYILAFLLISSFAFIQPVDFSRASDFPNRPEGLKKGITGATNIIFKSTDGGQTWQDISEGLPATLQSEGLSRDGFYASDNDVYIQAENGLYHSKPNSKAPFWEKEISPDNHSSIAPGKAGMIRYNYSGQFLQKLNGTDFWLPMYDNFQGKEIRTVFENERAAFVGCNRGLFKSTDNGKNWERVYDGGWVMKMVESDGVLLATSQRGIIRSTDDGESWVDVINEGGVGIAIERIKGGFAAITCNTETETRRVRTSYDGGKTWQAIDADLPASLYTASITEAGGYMFCGHPAGIFRSSDKGKTWKLLLPAIQDKVFNLSVSNNVIYAIPRSGGC